MKLKVKAIVTRVVKVRQSKTFKGSGFKVQLLWVYIKSEPFIRFLWYAKRSCTEVQNELYPASREKWCHILHYE